MKTPQKGSAMPTNPVIRPVAHSDYDEWLPFWDGYNTFYGRSGPTALDAAITRMTWARFFNMYEPVHAIVAEHDGRLVGLVHYLFHRSTTAIEPSCYLQDLFTSEATRGKGRGPRADRSGVRSGAARRSFPRVLADARDECDGDATLRQGGREIGLSRLSQNALGRVIHN